MTREELKIYAILFRRVGIKRLLIEFLTALGVMWLLTQVITFFVPGLQNLQGWTSFILYLLVAAVWSFIRNFPRRSILGTLSSSDVTIEVKVGDIFREDGHLVIGTNDVFDTELGDIIKRESIQGQFLDKIYRGDRVKLDQEIDKVLSDLKIKANEDIEKKLGKRMRYPIGTIAALSDKTRKYFLVAFAEMDKTCVATSDGFNLWNSLSCLWEEVRVKGQGEKVYIPIIGSGLSRTNLNRRLLAKIIITSFVVASRKKYVTKGLVLVIHPQDLGHVNIYNLDDFLEAVCA